MPSLRYLNCLLFAVHSEGNPDSWKPPAPPLERATIQETVSGFALLPPIQDKYPREFEILRRCFTKSGVSLISRLTDYPSTLTTAISDDRVEVVEVILDLKYFKTYDRITVKLDIFNEVLVDVLLASPFLVEASYDLCLPKPYSTYDSRNVLEEVNLPILEHLASFGADLRYRRENGGTFLHFAVEKLCEPLVSLLLRHGAQPEARTLKGLTPLHIAADTYDTPPSIINLLIKHGADVNSTSNGDTPLYVAMCCSTFSLDVVKTLLDSGARKDVAALGGSFQQLSIKSKSECLECYLSYQPEISVQDRRETLRAILKESYVRKKTVNVLLHHGFDLSFEDANDIDVFFNAVSANNLQLVQKLLEWGANIHSRTGKGLTVLHTAIRESASEDLIRLLLHHGADINAKTEFGATPLGFAIHKKIGVLKFLLANGARIEDDTTILHKAVENSWDDGSLGKIKFLLKKGANVNGRDNEGKTPISHSSYDTKKCILDILSRYGAKIDPEDKHIRDIMLCHIEEGKLGRLIHLVQIGANIEGSLAKALLTSIVEGRKKITRFLLDFGDPLTRTPDKGKLLERVLSSTKPAEIEDILEYNYLNIRDIIESSVFDKMMTLCLEHTNNPGRNLFGFRADSMDVFDAKDTLCSHISAVQAANLRVNQEGAEYELPQWLLESEAFYSKEVCEIQVNTMKNTIISGSSISFFDILNASGPMLVRLLENESVVQVLNGEHYGDFPIYHGIISKRFRRAYYRRSLIIKGIKMLEFLNKSFKDLPRELKERIFEHLSNQNLLVLTNVCKLPAGRSS